MPVYMDIGKNVKIQMVRYWCASILLGFMHLTQINVKERKRTRISSYPNMLSPVTLLL